jgi:hypothetical protein
MDLRTVLQSKDGAALEVLKQVIVPCPETLQNVPGNLCKVYKHLGTHKFKEHYLAS